MGKGGCSETMVPCNAVTSRSIAHCKQTERSKLDQKRVQGRVHDHLLPHMFSTATDNNPVLKLPCCYKSVLHTLPFEEGGIPSRTNSQIRPHEARKATVCCMLIIPQVCFLQPLVHQLSVAKAILLSASTVSPSQTALR